MLEMDFLHFLELIIRFDLNNLIDYNFTININQIVIKYDMCLFL